MQSQRGVESTAEDFIVPAEGETFAADDGTVSKVLDRLDPSPEEIRQYAESNMGLNLPEDAPYLYLVRELLMRPLPTEWKPCRTNDEVYYFNFRTGESSWDHPLQDEYMDKIEEEKERAARQQHQKATITSSSAAAVRPGPAQATTMAPLTTMSSSGSFTTNTNTNTNTPRRFQSEAEKQMETRIREEIRSKHEAQATQAATLHDAKLASLRHLHEKDKEEARQADNARRESLASRVDEQKRTRLEAVRTRCDDDYRTQLTDLGLKAQSLTKQLSQLEGELSRAGNSREKAEAERVAAEELARALRSLSAEMSTYKVTQQRDKDNTFSRMKRDIEAENQHAIEAARTELDEVFAKDIDEAQKKEEATRQELAARKAELTMALAKTKAAAAAAAADAADADAQEPGGSPVANDGTEAAALSAAEAAHETQKARHKAEEEAFKKEHEQVLTELRQQLRTTSSLLLTPSQTQLGPTTSINESATNTSSGGPGAPSVQAISTPTTQPPRPTAVLTFDEERKKLEQSYAEKKKQALAALAKKRESLLSAAAAAAAAAQKGSSQTRGASVSSSTTAASTINWNQAPSILALKQAHTEAQQRVAAHYEAMESRLTAQLAKELTDDAYATKTAFDKAVQDEVMAFEFDFYVEQAEVRRDRMQEEAEIKREKAIADHEIALAAHERHKAQTVARQATEKEELRTSMLDDLIKDRLEKEREKLTAASSASLKRRQSQYMDEELAIMREVDEEINAYERAERKKLELAALGNKAKQQDEQEKQQQEEKQRQEMEQKQRALSDEVAAIKNDLAAVRTAASRDDVQHHKTVQELSSRLAAAEEAATSTAKAAAAAAAETSAPPKAAEPPADEVVIKKIQPPNSTLRSTHQARQAALEESFKAQTREATAEVDRWRARRLALPAASAALTTAPAPTACGDSVSVGATRLRSASMDGDTYASLSRSEAGTGVSTTQYIANQHDHIRRRQQALLSARAQYQNAQQQQQQQQQQQRVSQYHQHQQQQQQQQQVYLSTHDNMTSTSLTAATSYPRSHSANRSGMWLAEVQSALPHHSLTRSPFRQSQVSTAHASGIEASGAVQVAAAVQYLNARLDQLSTHVMSTSHTRSRSFSPIGGGGSGAAGRSALGTADDRDGRHRSYRAQRRTITPSPSKGPRSQSAPSKGDVRQKWSAFLQNEVA